MSLLHSAGGGPRRRQRPDDLPAEDVEQLTAMAAPLLADVGRRGGDDHQIAGRGRRTRTGRRSPRRSTSRGRRCRGPTSRSRTCGRASDRAADRAEAARPRRQLARAALGTIGPPTRSGTTCRPLARPRLQIQLAEREQLARRHQHLVAAEVDALRIARPRRQREAERPGQRVVGEPPRAACRWPW